MNRFQKSKQMKQQIIRMTLLKVEVKSWWKQLFCSHNFNVLVRSLFFAEKRKTKKQALYQCCNCGKPKLTSIPAQNKLIVHFSKN